MSNEIASTLVKAQEQIQKATETLNSIDLRRAPHAQRPSIKEAREQATGVSHSIKAALAEDAKQLVSH